MFSKGPSFFCTLCFWWWGFEFEPACGSCASVSDHVMTSKDFIKVQHVSTDFLVRVLQRSNSFDLISFFQVLFNLVLTVYKGEIQLMALGSWSSTGVFWKVEKNVSVLFSSEIFKLFSHENPCFRKVLRFLYFLFIMMGVIYSLSGVDLCFTLLETTVFCERTRFLDGWITPFFG